MIGELIRIFRKERGIGVLELSNELSINRISLFRIEKEQRQPSEKTAIEAFKALGLSEEHIYQIFVFNDLMKWRKLSKKSTDEELKALLKRLKKRDGNSKILHEYFQRILNSTRDASESR